MPEQKEEIGVRARLKEAEAAVRSQPAAAMRLSTFLNAIERKGRLTRKDRLRIVEQSLLLLNMNYVHLPLKRAMHAVDPIQRLKLLRFRLLEMKESEMPSEMRFHQRMMEFYQSIPNAEPEVLSLEPGVEVLYWNAVPIRRAIELNGESQAGSNIEARF